jgi:hypothetical protein
VTVALRPIHSSAGLFLGSVKAGCVPTRPNVHVGALLLKRARDARQGRRVSLASGGVGAGKDVED